MKSKVLTHFRNSKFLYSSSIVLLGSFFVNFLNYIFTLIIGRMLGPIMFGEVTALFSFFIIVNVPATTIATFMGRQTSLYKSESRMSSIKHLVAFLDTWASIAGVVLWIIFVACTPFLSNYLNIPSTPIFVFGLIIPLSFVSSVSTGSLQGLQDFRGLQVQNIVGALVKLVFALLFVYMGMSVTGVMAALLLSTLWSLVYGFLKTIKTTGKMGFFSAEGVSDAEWSDATKKSMLFVFCASLLIALLSNVDVVMAKHYLSAFEAGQYGALSAIGKILLYGVAAFTTVLLPVASEAHASGSSHGRRALWTSVGLITLASVVLVAIFLLFPEMIVNALFGAAYIGIAAYLVPFAVAMYFVAIATVFVQYFIATHNRAFLYFFLIAILSQIAAITLHHGSLLEIVSALVSATGFLVVLMLFVYVFSSKSKSAI
jgi:O-antigen/teichoic acid export membrane protein